MEFWVKILLLTIIVGLQGVEGLISLLFALKRKNRAKLNIINFSWLHFINSIELISKLFYEFDWDLQ